MNGNEEYKRSGQWPEELMVLGPNYEGLEVISSLAHKRFSSGAFADEAATDVLDQLAADNWKKLKSCKDKSNPKSWLITMIKNLLEDYSRKIYGRPRPPSWIKSYGHLWVELWKAICLERSSVPEVLHRYESNTGVDIGTVDKAIVTIKAREPNCGLKKFEAMSVGDIATIENKITDDDSGDISEATSILSPSDSEVVAGVSSAKSFDSEISVNQNQSKAESMLLLMIKAVLDPDIDQSNFDAARVNSAEKIATDNGDKFTRLQQSLTLADEEIVLLRMIYFDGFTLQHAAKVLNIKRSKAVSMRNDCLQRIRQTASECDLDLETLLDKI